MDTQSTKRNMTSSPKTGDLRLYLQSELARRCKANPRYSLRSLAKFLGLQSSTLSKLLSGKRSFTLSTLEQIALKLEMSSQEINFFSQTIVEKRGRRSSGPTAPADPTYEQLSTDAFDVIAQWYHYAILELTHTRYFQSNLKWIARTLGISLTEARDAFERLQRLGMLEINKNGTWKDHSENVTNITGRSTSRAKKQLQKDILNLALRAIDEIHLSQRDNTSMTMAIDSELLPEAREHITQFRRNLCTLLQRSKKKDAVYQLSISLFPISTDPQDSKQNHN